MLKQVVTYEDYNGNPSTETLYFNLTKTEMMNLLDLKPRFDKWVEITSGPERDLTTVEIRELLEIVKILIEMSYGIRSEDGKRFAKSDQILTDFKQSAVYDAFVFGLFEHPENAVNFMTNILPKDIVETARGTKINDVPLPLDGIPSGEFIPEKKFEDYTKSELDSMPTDEFNKLVGTTDPQKMTRDQLLVAMSRKMKDLS